MKQLLGAAILLLVLALAGLLGLHIWGLSLISQYTLLRSGTTLALLAATLVVLIIVRFAFFRNPAACYDPTRGNRAHPKQ